MYERHVRLVIRDYSRDYQNSCKIQETQVKKVMSVWF